MRRVACAAAAGLTMLAALMCVLGTVATRTVVVAAVDIERGTAIEAGMLRLAQWPIGDGAVLEDALDSLDGLRGIAQVDIVAGQPMYRPMIRDQPTIPDGFTVIEVRLASDGDALMNGDEIALASATGCTDAADDGPSSDACVLVERAMVMRLGTSAGRTSNGYAAVSTTPLAMSAVDALRVMAAQEAGAIVAVTR
ncbi:SAF domain-containing protein [Bifidobacterium sp. SO1]|uniref:SAF domain-containing protein n=1 Tax=Bifidobacterium sp. SO1 TaxID=2809029 RepID=UPI001BDCCA7B|nr:SAF domain-containing protein [Bifidobacterium sp. SO1]MBT1160554.1 flagellar biosynthesis protein FlgA [Bifidobacterium sp. SO1]